MSIILAPLVNIGFRASMEFKDFGWPHYFLLCQLPPVDCHRPRSYHLFLHLARWTLSWNTPCSNFSPLHLFVPPSFRDAFSLLTKRDVGYSFGNTIPPYLRHYPDLATPQARYATISSYLFSTNLDRQHCSGDSGLISSFIVAAALRKQKPRFILLVLDRTCSF